MNLFSLEGKTAVVTGASRGLGQAMAIALAKAGAQVVCSSSREGGCSQTVSGIEALGRNAWDIPANLTEREAIDRFVHTVFSTVEEVHILVNNAGTITRHPAHEYPLDEWDMVLQVNLSSLFHLCQSFGAPMLERKSGKIINTASLLTFSGGITVPAYAASKHGVAGVTKALANEWAAHNVQINAIAPGYFRTDNTQALQDNPVRNEQIQGRIPAGRWGEPDDLGGAAVFLASAASDYVNGHVLTVDGGWMAR
ncbi:MAG: SDR family NAD(P)-dependent oxidoreductase [Bacteroidota bacterium]